MFLTVHAASGIVIGQYLQNPLLAFITGLIFHYIFDIIPHGDTRVLEKYKNPIHIALAGIIDLIVLLIFLIILLGLKVDLLNFSIISATFGAMLPDILQAFYYIYRGKIFTKTQYIHNLFHDMISKKHDMTLIPGLIFQFIILILLTLIII